MSKTIHRILQLIQHLNLSARQFDMSIGTANGYTLRMYKNNASVGSDVIERIKEVYPQINLIWLLTGQGDMLIKETPQPKNISPEEVELYISKYFNEKWSKEKKELMREILKEIDSEIGNKD